MKLDSHDLLAALALVGVVVLVVSGNLEASAALTFLGGLVLRSPLDRGADGSEAPPSPGD